MSDDFGACVVLLPGLTELPEEVDGGHHITLLYLGDKTLADDRFQEILEIVEKVSAEAGDIDTEIRVLDEEFLGQEEEAHVLTVDRHPHSPAVVLRKRLLGELTPELLGIFEDAETYPEYKPHMTLGYTTDGYIPQAMSVPATIPLVGLAVWNGEQRISFPLDLRHYGTLHKSGRYPWGSGENPNQRYKPFLAVVDDLKKKGLSETQIAEGMGMSTTELRARKAIEKNNARKENAAQAFKLKERGMSNVAIGERLGLPESTVRSLLNPMQQMKNDELVNAANQLKQHMIDKDGYLDIGAGTEHHLGISDTKLRTAVAMLEQEGYVVHNVQVPQLGVGGNKKTTVKVLAPEGTTYRDIVSDPSKIKSVSSIDRDGVPRLGMLPPRSVSSKRIGVRYAEDGGADMDGVIQLRRGVDDISLGDSRYAQVRIAVDGTHYLKGMAMYSDDLPAGVDIMFNTNKSNTGKKLDAMKPMKDDPDNPFGSSIKRQRMYKDSRGREQQSALNIVNEEGNWFKWGKTLSSQMLSKQSPALAKEQLDLAYDMKKAEYDSIVSLTNPVVKQKLLTKFADGADSSAVHLKAAGLPRTRNHVILPVTDMKDTEIYAPNYRDGEKVVLIRHPHGGKFEIPELTVNNRHPGAKRALGNAIDAVGINPKVAERLSGADFDGDTVLVIPNNSRKVKSEPALAGLKNFDPKQYKLPDDAPKMTPRAKQREMGDVSNLITDMTIKGANNHELARAVKHSMVVIDAEKHHLDYKQSAKDNGIRELKIKYQGKDGQPGKSNSGASTLISLAGSEARVPVRKERRAGLGGAIDPATGKKVYVETGDSYTDSKGVVVPRTMKVKKLELADDAHDLSSGTRMEEVYANHSNKLKALANQARKESLVVKPKPMSPSAKKVYDTEVKSLDAKLKLAQRNKPLERRAQLLANATITSKRQSNPDMTPEELKKLNSQALLAARHRVGAEKSQIEITPREWEAIQAGGISPNKLSQILDHTDIAVIKAYATPREARVMTTPVMNKAKAMLARGYTQAEVAEHLGIAASTINSALISEGS